MVSVLFYRCRHKLDQKFDLQIVEIGKNKLFVSHTKIFMKIVRNYKLILSLAYA